MNYTKFIILGQGRTGSNLLLSLLASHRQIFVVGEVFNAAEEVRKKIKKLPRPLKSGEHPIEYLEAYLYKVQPEHIKAVGFKLFYEHARDNEWKDVWQYLRRSKVKILHLKRKNLLDRYLSHQLALRSNVWISFKPGNGKFNNPIKLQPQKCFQDFHRTLRRQENIDGFFSENPKLEIIYEELCDNPIENSKNIQDFLGLNYQALSAKTIKQRIKKKSELILNYNDLKEQLIQARLNGKEWAKEEWLEFFDEA